MRKIKILVADDHGVLRSGLRMMLNAQEDMEVIGEAGSGDEVLELCMTLSPDIILLDLSMPGKSSMELVREIKRRKPTVRFLVLTMHDNEHYLRDALKAGCSGYILKKAADTELLSAIRSVYAGGVYIDPNMTTVLINELARPAPMSEGRETQVALSNREKEVLRLIALGYTHQQIANELFISVKTVETYTSRLKTKLRMSRRSELVRYALKAGLVKPD